MQIVNLVVQAIKSPERKRLAAAVEVTATAAESLKEQGNGQINELVSKAALEAKEGDLDKGWRFQREASTLIAALRSPSDVKASLTSLTAEAETILSWRREAVRMLLASLKNESTEEEQRTILRQAAAIRDEHYNNVHFRSRLLRRQMMVLGVVLVIMVGLFFLAIAIWPLSGCFRMKTTGGSQVSTSFPTFNIAAILGAMGACLSALITFSTGSAL